MTVDNGSQVRPGPAQPPTLTGQDIAEAQGALRALLDQALAGTGTSSNGYVVLKVLAVRGPSASPVTFHDYLVEQRQLGLDSAGVVSLLNMLEDEGLITGSNLGGSGPVELTAKGAARHADLAEGVKPLTQQVFTGLEVNDLAVAHRVLVRVTERADRVRRAL